MFKLKSVSSPLSALLCWQAGEEEGVAEGGVLGGIEQLLAAAQVIQPPADRYKQKIHRREVPMINAEEKAKVVAAV